MRTGALSGGGERSDRGVDHPPPFTANTPLVLLRACTASYGETFSFVQRIISDGHRSVITVSAVTR